MRTPAQKLIETLQTKARQVLTLLLIFFIMLNIALQVHSINKLSDYIESMDQKLFEIEQSIDSIRSRIDYIEQDISSLHISLEEMVTPDELENSTAKEEPAKETNQPLSSGNEEKDKIVTMIFEIAPKYDLSPYMIMAMVERESNYKPNAVNGEYKGLLQISERWHRTRMNELGVTDLFDPAGNIAVACDYLKTLYDLHQDQELVLMCYSMNNDKAIELHKKGQVSVYATAIIDRMRELEEGYGD